MWLFNWIAVIQNIYSFYFVFSKARDEKHVEEGRGRSWTRKYYTRVNEKLIKCKICERLLRLPYNNSGGNIHRHIKFRHPYIYFNENKSNTSGHDSGDKEEEKVLDLDDIALKDSQSDNDAVDSTENSTTTVKNVDIETDEDKTQQFASHTAEDNTKTKHISHNRRYYSWTRKYYRIINDNYIKCKICKKILTKNILNNGNIHRHIRTNHPAIYINETRRVKALSDDSDVKEIENSILQTFNVKKLGTIFTNKSDVQNNETSKFNAEEIVDDMPNVDETGHHFTLIEDRLKIKPPSQKRRSITNKRRKLSWTRKYYTVKSDKSAKCVLCKAILALGSNGNINRHIKKKHRDVYLSETKATTKELIYDDSYFKETDNAVKEIFYIKEVDKIVLNDINTKDDDAFESQMSESVDDMQVADKTEQSPTGTDEVANRIIKRKNQSWTRPYYQKINNSLIKCKICHIILNMNIHRHIRNKHPDIYYKEHPIPSTQGPSFEEELRIKKLCATRRYSKSCFWNFFEMIEQDHLYKCGFCQKTVAIFPKSVGNLKRHLRNAHFKQYEIISEYGDIETTDLVSLAASGADVPGMSSIEIAFLSLEGDDIGKFKCTRCDTVIESTEENSDSVLIEHVQECQLNPEPTKIGSDA